MGAIKCIKYLLFSFNFVFWLAGLGALGIGIWMYIDPGSLNDFMGKYSFKIPSVILMGAGSIVMLTGFLGCLGAIRESRCLLGTFFFMLLIIFCAEIACGIMGFLFRDKIDSEVKKQTEDIIKKKYGTGNIDLDHAVDVTQKKFKCCGALGPTDYSGSKWETNAGGAHTGRVPQSCCKVDSSNRCTQPTIVNIPDDVYQKGCVDEIKKYAKDHMLIIGGIAIGVGAIQINTAFDNYIRFLPVCLNVPMIGTPIHTRILGMIFSLCLFFSIDDM